MSLRASLTQVAAGTVGLLKTRLELFSLEAASEKARIVRTLGLAFAALLFLTLAVLVFSKCVCRIRRMGSARQMWDHLKEWKLISWVQSRRAI